MARDHPLTGPSASLSQTPNPWLDNPAPISQEYSGVITRLRHFTSHITTMREAGKVWPYRLVPNNSGKLFFFEFRGYGPPPRDIGSPGDIYLDVTPSSTDRYLLYIYEHQWKCSNWSPNPNTTKFKPVKHSLLAGRFLWGSEKRGFSWVTPQTVRRKIPWALSVFKTTRVDLKPMVIDALKYDENQDDPFPELPLTEDNIRRRDREILRRNKEWDKWRKTNVQQDVPLTLPGPSSSIVEHSNSPLAGQYNVTGSGFQVQDIRNNTQSSVTGSSSVPSRKRDHLHNPEGIAGPASLSTKRVKFMESTSIQNDELDIDMYWEEESRDGLNSSKDINNNSDSEITSDQDQRRANVEGSSEGERECGLLSPAENQEIEKEPMIDENDLSLPDQMENASRASNHHLVVHPHSTVDQHMASELENLVSAALTGAQANDNQRPSTSSRIDSVSDMDENEDKICHYISGVARYVAKSMARPKQYDSLSDWRVAELSAAVRKEEALRFELEKRHAQYVKENIAKYEEATATIVNLKLSNKELQTNLDAIKVKHATELREVIAQRDQALLNESTAKEMYDLLSGGLGVLYPQDTENHRRIAQQKE